MEASREQVLARVRRLCRVVSVIFYIVFAVWVFAFLVSLILSGCAIFGYGYFTSIGDWSPSAPGYSQCELVTEGLTFLSWSALAGTAFFIAARMFGKIAKTGDPFSRARAHELKIAAWFNIAAAVVPALLAACVSTAGFGTPYVPDGFSINYDMILVSIILLAFAYIFDYGCILQKQDDELL